MATRVFVVLAVALAAGCGGATSSTPCATSSDCSGGGTCDLAGACLVPATGGDDGGTACASDTWTNYASSAFSNNCGSCHSWATSYSGVRGSASLAASKLSSGAMPPAGMSTSDRGRLTKWLSCGLPQ